MKTLYRPVPRMLLVRNRFLIVVKDTYYYFQDLNVAYEFCKQLNFKYQIEYL